MGKILEEIKSEIAALQIAEADVGRRLDHARQVTKLARKTLLLSCDVKPPENLGELRSRLRNRISGEASTPLEINLPVPELAVESNKINQDLFLGFVHSQLRASEPELGAELLNILDYQTREMRASDRLLDSLDRYKTPFLLFFAEIASTFVESVATERQLEVELHSIRKNLSRAVEEKQSAIELEKWKRRQEAEKYLSIALGLLRSPRYEAHIPQAPEYYIRHYPNTKYAEVFGEFSSVLSERPDLAIWILRWLTLDMTPAGTRNAACCKREFQSEIAQMRHVAERHLPMAWPDVRELIDKNWASLDGHTSDVDAEFWGVSKLESHPEDLLRDLIEAEIRSFETRNPKEALRG